MKIRIRNALHFVKYSDEELEANITVPFSKVIEDIKEKFKPKDDNIRYTIVRGDQFIPLNDFSKTLSQYNFTEKDSILVEAVEGFEVPSYVVTLVSYLGPPLFFTYYFILNKNNLDYIKILSTVLIYLHFFRRIIESTYYFKHGRERMAVKDVLGVGFYYYIFNGLLMGYSIFSSDYSHSTTINDYFKVGVLTCFFLLCEYGNSYSHFYLANLKSLNNGQRAIPQGGVFNYVDCAHYFYELLSWVFFSFIVNVTNSYLFIVYSFMSMGFLAYGRHQNMKKYFGERYPKGRKAFIPFLF